MIRTKEIHLWKRAWVIPPHSMMTKTNATRWQKILTLTTINLVLDQMEMKTAKDLLTEENKVQKR